MHIKKPTLVIKGITMPKSLYLIALILLCTSCSSIYTKRVNKLLWYSHSGDTDQIERYLEKKDIDINSQDSKGFTALMKASEARDYSTVSFLIDNDADVNIESDIGWTALMFTAINDDIRTATLLVEKGANVNHRTMNKASSLSRAVANNRIEMVEFLIEHNANVNSININGESILDIAIRMNNNRIIELLRNAGATGVKFESSIEL